MPLSNITIRAIVLGATVVVVAFVRRFLSTVTPPKTVAPERIDELRTKYKWLENLSHVAALTGMWGSLIFFSHLKKNTPWIFGGMLGWSVILPIFLIAAFTLPHGRSAWVDFWDFYASKHKISVQFLFWFFSFFTGVGIASNIILFN